jgi:hypothetical protein
VPSRSGSVYGRARKGESGRAAGRTRFDRGGRTALRKSGLGPRVAAARRRHPGRRRSRRGRVRRQRGWVRARVPGSPRQSRPERVPRPPSSRRVRARRPEARPRVPKAKRSQGAIPTRVTVTGAGPGAPVGAGGPCRLRAPKPSNPACTAATVANATARRRRVRACGERLRMGVCPH